MNIPGFTAEASLFTSLTHGREMGHPLRVDVERVVPQLRDGPVCQPDGFGRLCCYDPYVGYYCFRVHGFPE